MDFTAFLKPSHEILAGKTAFITGASSGIGLASACQLAEIGVHLKLVARRQERLEAIQTFLRRRFGIEVEILSADLSQPEAMQNLDAAQFFEADIVINNAGLASGRDAVADSQAADWQRMLDLNINAAFEINRRVVPRFLARGQGDLVCLGSIAGHIAYEGGAIYCASKHALRAFCESLRRETAGQNLRVMLISPGMVETEFSEVRLGSAEAAAAIYADMTPLTPADIARQIVFALQQPRHVNWDELVITAQDQGGVKKVVRHSL